MPFELVENKWVDLTSGTWVAGTRTALGSPIQTHGAKSLLVGYTFTTHATTFNNINIEAEGGDNIVVAAGTEWYRLCSSAFASPSTFLVASQTGPGRLDFVGFALAITYRVAFQIQTFGFPQIRLYGTQSTNVNTANTFKIMRTDTFNPGTLGGGF